MTGKAATRSDEVRVLPFRVRPLPDEPLDSWLEKMAATYGATMNEMACALGLIEHVDGVGLPAPEAPRVGRADPRVLLGRTGVRCHRLVPRRCPR